MGSRWRRLLALLGSTLIAGALLAAPPNHHAVTAGAPCPTTPDEVTGVVVAAPSTLSWDPDPCATSFNVYRGRLEELASGQPARCHASDVTGTSFETIPDPSPPGTGYFFLITAEASAEGPPGVDSDGAARALLGSCDGVLRKHVLDRIGYGWSEWARDEIETLGLQGFIDAQLDPQSIDESTNTELATRTINLVPPEAVWELSGLDLVTAVYARRQLEQQVTLFWSNHFSTYYPKSQVFFNVYNPDLARRRLETTKVHYEEQETFRQVAFGGSFRQIAEVSAKSPAMIIFLDTKDNRAVAPNENYARELLELHTMGVDGGYTDADVIDLARIFTGWNVCKKVTADVDDPLAPCIDAGLIGTPEEPEGAWVANFRTAEHDCDAKILFGSVTIGPTCGDDQAMVAEVDQALDAIVAHPSTPEFISHKLLVKFVTEQPTQPMVDQVVAEWNDGTNPAGVGDLREALRAALGQARFLDPDSIGNKTKTPFEHLASGMRAVRGMTNGGSQAAGFLQRMGHSLHQNPVPTGYAELGAAWIDTNGTLERTAFAEAVAIHAGNNFGSDLINLLLSNGVSNADGNAPAIVDFFSGVLYGGAVSPAERQAAIDFLLTDNSGVPDPDYNNTRIRQTAGFMMGYPLFQEQ